MHKINSYQSYFDSDIVKIALKGAENLQFYKSLIPKNRKVFTLPLLKLLSHSIATSNFSQWNKQCIWTAFVVAFFGSFRFGELLPSCDKYNCAETLCWSDIQFKTDRIQIHIKIPKSRSQKGEFIDLFPFDLPKYCPVRALKKLFQIQGCMPSGPVFLHESKKAITVSKLNVLLHSLLEKSIGNAANFYSGHSFRAALPAALAACPQIASIEDVRYWGRWSSDAYKHYTRLQPIQRRNIFEKIVSCLNLIN